jgi:hypothetical protein
MEKFERKVEYLKIDKDERKVWGIFSVSKIGDELLVDSQNDVIEPHELEKAAHDFVLNTNKTAEGMGNSHKKLQVGQLIESFVFTAEKAEFLEKSLKDLGADATIRPGADIWFGGFYVSDDATWDLIKSGDFESFSIGGKAEKVELS